MEKKLSFKRAGVPLISDLLVFVAGLLMIILHNRAQILEMIIIIIGIMFILPSCIAIITLLANRIDSNLQGLSLIPAFGGLALGIALVAVPEFFIGMLSYTFAILLIIGAIFRFWGLLSRSKYVRFPIAVYVIPSLLLICGIVILSTSVSEIANVLVLITGISFVAYSVNSVLEYILYRKYQKTLEQ